ncbi:probable mitochondrial import inner membrane translocase subunit TIM21 [Oryza brachyantha]|uniref:Mitochondrial import inner membrane translocase subunit Tim21 n=1 Tax=Oryza brachyantha TaxID=4533 RepID=J3LM33_ORYBR|nr:probable mitochondrial import inner membrane translocase subunit TIM21 [Oryza brachyantha]XP_006649757.1 probable mitochondrial import inner membrane translocase subunit TIM21 [Oryza brachyantha]XP_006649758.1 probable mitochondrial import inner membrane translocase subunit TIM21 [Oryza brachyantha]
MASRITRLLQPHHRRRLFSTAAEASSRRPPARSPLGAAAAPKHDVAKAEVSSLKNSRWYMMKSNSSSPLMTHNESRKVSAYLVRPCASYSTKSSDQNPKEGKKDLTTVEDPFDAPTYNIPEKPVTFAEGASYSLVIVAGLGIAALAGYAVFKELIFEPKEYKIFGKALARVQNDSQVTAKIGYPVTGYGNESRNRAARQRIPNKIWTDEEGVEHVEVNFYIRGPHGAGKVYSEMFKDNNDRNWKFTYLIVEIVSPHRSQLMLESYVPA